MIYADSSFLVSLYGPDANSGAAVRAIRTVKQPVVVATLGALEVVNAFGLRVYRKEASALEAQVSLRNFQKDLREGILELRPLPDQVFERAQYLSEQTTARLGTGATDLLHVAAALEMGAEFVYSFDKRQRALARAVHLKLN
ncbi:MAG: type II toxin-antitoxin system VapC family toxin [Candidatus Korobacteraceae bacterium]